MIFILILELLNLKSKRITNIYEQNIIKMFILMIIIIFAKYFFKGVIPEKTK